jgi:hypothetical protein
VAHDRHSAFVSKSISIDQRCFRPSLRLAVCVTLPRAMKHIATLITLALNLGADTPTRSPADRLTADREVTTSSGATFTAPGGWSVTTSGRLIVSD